MGSDEELFATTRYKTFRQVSAKSDVVITGIDCTKMRSNKVFLYNQKAEICTSE